MIQTELSSFRLACILALQMTSSTSIRIGIVGAGANTRAKHIPLLQAIEGVEIVAVANRRRSSAEAAAQEFGIPHVFDRWEDLVDDPGTDAIVIGTWPYLHCPVTLRSLAANKHVLTEARMAMNVAEAREMLSVAERHPNQVTQIVPSPMTLGVDGTIKQCLSDGTIGNLLAIDCSHGTSFYDPESPLHWRQDIRLSGLNIMTMGIWYEAIMRWAGHVTDVMAMGRIFTKTREDASGTPHTVQVPEHLDVIATLPSGAQLHLQESAITPPSPHNRVRLIGSHGVIEFDGQHLTLATPSQPEAKPIPIPAHLAGHWRVEEEFIQAIRGIAPITHTTFADGVRYMEFTEAVHRSITSGKRIPFPLVD